MTRYFSALVAGLLIAVHFGPAADAKKLVLRWHGQSFFDLTTTKGTRVVFDPHAIEGYGRHLVKADLICISHFHDDHTQIGSVENFRSAKLLPGLKGSGKKVEWNLLDEKFRDIRLRTVGVYHDDAKGMMHGLNTIFILEVDGLRIVHLGDLGHPLSADQIAKIGPVDVLMIPCGGVYSLNGIEAKKVVAQLKPRMYIVPMHYGTKAAFLDELLPVDSFLEDQKKETVRMERTNELVIDPAFKPKEPITVVLHWAAK